MSNDRPSRPAKVGGVALVLAAAAGLALPVPIASAAPVQPGSATVSVTAKDPSATALRAAKVTVSGGRPATVKRSRWTLPVSRSPAAGTTSVDLSGRLTFARGKRSVSFTSLRLTLGKKPAISGKAGKKRVTILTLSGAPKRNAAAGTISLKNATTSLSPAAVRILRTKLATSRVKAGRLGKTTVAVRTAATSAPVKSAPPAPAPPASAPLAPAVVVPPAPQPPAEPCWDGNTPIDKTDWIVCDQPGGSALGLGNLRSWVNYVLFPWPRALPGSIHTASGASRVTAGQNYDYRLTRTAVVPDGSGYKIEHAGRITYLVPAHGIEIWVEDLEFHVAADRKRALVSMQAYYTPRGNDTDPLPPITGPVADAMTVDLTQATQRAAGSGFTTYEHAPARLTASGAAVWGYDEEAPWGAFTITIPD